ncbi:hypothetical protein [Sinorhizobium meliloti]|uniref:hypothetical protein n=1 Tax=Rhizobium meliloti TaxID=382 RepID=UPI000FD9E7E2|nr:hypothetical protein [Sinorhizobium meliloti]RVI59922.1 hypothetical protein CN189_23675 [Sinorhizobium meliloti]
MPTGYTANIHDGTETTLRQFALRCAHGMGALITMRDEPLSAPIPTRLEPSTSYYDKTIDEASARIAELKAMSESDRALAAAEHNRQIEECRRRRVEENNAMKARYDAMITQTEAWQGAPEGLKEFMLDQLKQSRDFDISDDPLRYMEDTVSTDAWFASQLLEADRRLQYATEQRNSEIDRTNKRNEWLAQLHAALPAA